MSAEKVGATPGPWMGSGSYVLAPDGFVAMVGCVHRDSLVCAANGALIAAAPDLLALAKRYARECSDAGLDNNHILEVIRKAEGK